VAYIWLYPEWVLKERVRHLAQFEWFNFHLDPFFWRELEFQDRIIIAGLKGWQLANFTSLEQRTRDLHENPTSKILFQLIMPVSYAWPNCWANVSQQYADMALHFWCAGAQQLMIELSMPMLQPFLCSASTGRESVKTVFCIYQKQYI